MASYYDYGEVARSVFIAVLASYAALDLAGRVTAARGRIRLAWLAGGALAMGLGIWTMHLKGMLAFHLPVQVAYDWPTALLSLLLAIFASAFSLYIVSRPRLGIGRASAASVIMGIGIAGMHYVGMAAPRLPAVIRYSPLPVTWSVLLAILFSVIALLMAFGLREENKWTVPRRLGSAAVMGVAVSAMHYTGMAAARFIPASPPDLSHAVSISPIANNGIGIVTLIVIVVAITTSFVDRRATAGVRQLNEELEGRVAERTLQLEAVNQELRKEIAERQRAEDAVRRSEEHLRLVIDTIPQQIMSGPNDGTLDFANAQWRSYTGLTLEGLQGTGWQRIIHPDDREPLLKAVEGSRAQGKPYEQEVRRRGADGQYRWFLARGVPLKDSEGRIVRWYGSNTDIQDRKEAENRLRLVIDTAPAMLHSARPDGYVDYFNKRWLEYVGVSLEEILGWRWTDVIHPEDVENVVGKWCSSVENGKPFEAEARLRRADGEYRLMLLRKVPLRDEAGSIVKWYGSATDIEDRMRAEQELRQAEEHIRAILEYSPNWIFLKDTEGRYLLVNREIERVFGISQEQMKGKTDSEIFSPEQAAEYRGNDLKVLRTGLTMEFEEIALLEDGLHTSIVHKFPLFDNHGRIYAIGGVATDITERKRAEEARRYSEEQYRTVVETATDAVVSIDEQSKILFVNPATTKIFGYDTSELVGQPLSVLMPESLRKLHEAGFRRYLATGERHLNWQGTELTALRKTGHEFPVEVSFGEMISNGHKVFTGFIRDISEKKSAEDELRRQKEVFQKIFENIPVLIAFRGPGGDRLELVNPEWERTTGWRLEEILDQNLNALAEFFPDPHYGQVIRDLIAASTGQWTDIRVRVRDGRFLDLTSAFVHLSDGSTLFIARDITERKQAEEALRTSEREQHNIAEQLETERARLIEAQAVAKVGSWETELPSLDITWSEQTHRIFETDPSYFHPTRPGFVKLVHPEDRAKVDAAFEASLEKVAPSKVEYRIVMADGRVKVLEEHWEVFRDEQGRPARLMGTCQDITERKRMVEALRDSEARFRLVADSAPVMIWMSGTDKLCTYFNKPWLDFTGRSLDQEFGNGWAGGVDAEDLLRCMDTYIQAFDQREAFRMEYRLRRHDGEFRWVSDNGVPRFNPDGSFAGYIGSCIDVTEQRRAEEHLRRAQEDLARVSRVLAMGELAASIAHEVNQPLTSVVTNAGFCLRELAGAPPNLAELREALTEIVSDGNRASAVIARVRSFLARGAPERAEVDINEAIQEVTRLVHREVTKGSVSVRLNLAADLPPVFGDRVQLQQVLINLIMNAIEEMSTRSDKSRNLLIKTSKKEDAVVVGIQDSGRGLDTEKAEHIFEPFFSTKPNGIGMGLWISRSIVESHGGRLWSESTSQGALFQFTVPTVAPRMSHDECLMN